MPQDHLAHNFKRHSATACMGGSVTSEIVRSQMYTDKVAGLSESLCIMFIDFNNFVTLNISLHLNEAKIKDFIME